MKVDVLWTTPEPEKTIALAMRRCYSTKTLEEILLELESKGPGYWKHLIELAIRDKSYDVIEHFCLLVLLEDCNEEEIHEVGIGNRYINFTRLKPGVYLASLNARTLLELIYQNKYKRFGLEILRSIQQKRIADLFTSLILEGVTFES
ncbi:MAG: hypothetical protein QXE12_04150 [Conexivisphaerales archaeon]